MLIGAVIVVALAGGVALLVSIATGGSSSSGKTPTASTSQNLLPSGTGAVPTGNTDTMLAGNATPTYPAGDAGQLAVVYLGPVTDIQGGGANVPVVIATTRRSRSHTCR